MSVFQQYADDSVEHRNPADPDVAVVIHEVQKWAEIEHLRQQGRLLSGADGHARTCLGHRGSPVADMG